MNKRILDQLLEKYDTVISEGLYQELLNPITQPFEKQFNHEPLVFTCIRALEQANKRSPDKETTALLALIHGHLDPSGLRSRKAIKDRAHRAADHLGIKHLLALEYLARQYGYGSWAALLASGEFHE